MSVNNKSLVLICCILIISLKGIQSEGVSHGTWGNLKYTRSTTTAAPPVEFAFNDRMEDNNPNDHTYELGPTSENSDTSDADESTNVTDTTIITSPIFVSENTSPVREVETHVTANPDSEHNENEGIAETTTVQTVKPPSQEEITETTVSTTRELPSIITSIQKAVTRQVEPRSVLDILTGKTAYDTATEQYSSSSSQNETECCNEETCNSCSNDKPKSPCAGGSDCSKYNIISNNYNGTFTFNFNVNECRSACKKGTGCHC